MKRFFKTKPGIAVLAIIAVGAVYYGYTLLTGTGTPAPQYITAKVERGTLIVSTTGSGQVSASNQVDIKPKVSNEVMWVGVSPGDVVRVGQALIKIDDTQAKQAVVSAEQSLEASKLQYQKDTVQAPIDYQKALDALDSAKNDIATQYNDTFNILSSTYLDLPDVVTGMQGILYGSDINPKSGQWNVDALISLFSDKNTTKIEAFARSAENDYAVANEKYDSSVLAYKQTSRFSSGNQIEAMLNQSIETVTAIAQALQSELNVLGTANDLSQQYSRSLPAVVKTIQTNARNYLGTANSDLSALLSQKKSIDAGKQTITADEQSIILLQVGNSSGDNPISLQISKNNLASQGENLVQLRDALNNYVLIAPFDGVVASVSAKKGDIASGVALTIISNQQLAQATFNEVDIVNIKVGQKATITFDALPNITLTGKVVQVDPQGTVTQGVVSYKAQVALDVPNASVKPGMSDTVAIITNVKQDTLLVPNAAVSTKQGISTVQVMGVNGMPQQMPVTLGLSNDTDTEILSGVAEGDTVVTQTVTKPASGAATTQRTTGGLGIPGLGGGGALRAVTGGGAGR